MRQYSKSGGGGGKCFTPLRTGPGNKCELEGEPQPRAPPPIALNLSQHNSALRPPPYASGAAELQALPKVLSSHLPQPHLTARCYRQLGDTISTSTKKHAGWQPCTVPPTKDDPVDLQHDCNTAPAPLQPDPRPRAAPSRVVSTPSPTLVILTSFYCIYLSACDRYTCSKIISFPCFKTT